MICSTTYHCKSRKSSKFKRNQQYLKFFNYCKKARYKDFWKELRQFKMQENAVEESI